jgi:hypothetical protein
MTDNNYFEYLNQIDVSDHIEKKGKFSYLSWTWAVQQLAKRHPEYEIEVRCHPDTGDFFWPMADETGFVWVEVIVNGIVRGTPFPVLDHRNKPIASPDAFAVNTALQRAKVKAIAEHGLGLYIYAGEDLPDVPPEPMGEQYVEKLDIAAAEGHDAFVTVWKRVPKAQRALATEAQIEGWKRVAQATDAEQEATND